jgi:formylglycine-generating enzyme required for sulfatase activity
MGLELPSEAQWENGCRAGTSSVYWCGDEPASLQGVANLSDAYGKSHGQESWTSWEAWLEDGQSVHAEVGSYRPNAFGLFDTHGNEWELCLDGYDSGFYARSPKTDPGAPWEGAADRVARGGGFSITAVSARSANRIDGTPADAGIDVGLRPARVIPD